MSMQASSASSDPAGAASSLESRYRLPEWLNMSVAAVTLASTLLGGVIVATAWITREFVFTEVDAARALSRLESCKTLVSSGERFWERMADFSTNASASDKVSAERIADVLKERKPTLDRRYQQLLTAIAEASPVFTEAEMNRLNRFRGEALKGADAVWDSTQAPLDRWDPSLTSYHVAIRDSARSAGTGYFMRDLRAMCRP